MSIPLVGRLSMHEWPFVILSLIISWLEYLISIITQILPYQVIDFFTNTTKVVYKQTSNPINLIRSLVTSDVDNGEDVVKYKYYKYENNLGETREAYERMIDMINSDSIQEMVALFGYEVESRVIQTQDNYFLTLHRLVKPNDDVPRNGRTVYLHHGLLMSSEIWVTMLNKNQNLPFVLYELGYDVWMGNNRGNKYSQKHLFHSISSEAFWDFSLDEFALFDIPNSIEYIVSATQCEKITYIGFSQGTAQIFAALSINQTLHEKIDQIIAISPATTPQGLHSKFLDTFLKSSPNLMYLIFSRRILMPSVNFWRRIMYPPLFSTMIDMSNYLLFEWKSENITKFQKLSSYAHLYLTTSVKTVVHWFQIMSSKNFQMYHESASRFSPSAPVYYPLHTVKVPIHLIYGSTDSLVDIDVMMNQLPAKYTTAHAVPRHEHLDNLWGYDVDKRVFEFVLQYLDEPNIDIPASQKKPAERHRNYLASSPDDITLIPPQTHTSSLSVTPRKPSSAGSLFV